MLGTTIRDWHLVRPDYKCLVTLRNEIPALRKGDQKLMVLTMRDCVHQELRWWNFVTVWGKEIGISQSSSCPRHFLEI